MSEYDQFQNSCQPQTFSFPKTIMEYFLFNPKSPTCYLKTIKSCKIIFLKNPILIIPILRYTKCDGWKYSITNESESFYGGLKSINLENIKSKIWITEILRIFPDLSNIASNIIPKIYKCDANTLQLENQTISFNQLKILIASVTYEINFDQVTVEKEDGTVVLIDELIDHLSDVVIFIYWFCDNYSTISTKEGTEKLANYCCTKSLRFSLYNIFDGFDLETFFNCLKENKNGTFVELDFCRNISEDYKNRIYGIVDQILETESFDYLPPRIGFPDMDDEILCRLCSKVAKEEPKYY